MRYCLCLLITSCVIAVSFLALIKKKVNFFNTTAETRCSSFYPSAGGEDASSSVVIILPLVAISSLYRAFLASSGGCLSIIGFFPSSVVCHNRGLLSSSLLDFFAVSNNLSVNMLLLF